MAQPQDQKLKSNFKWQAALSKIEKIEETPAGVFTSQREAERAISIYNRALEHLHTGNEDIAMIALEKLVATYPLFTDAAVLYGLSLGADRKYKNAELQFNKALLTDPDPADVEVLRHLQAQACLCKDRDEELERSRRRNEKKLLPVRASLAQAGILERAAGSADGDGVRMASSRERDDLMRQINQGNKGSYSSSSYGSRNKTVQIISIVIIIAALLFFLVYFLIAPAIAKANDRNRRLDWLEEKLVEGAETDEAFQVILDDYQRTFSE
jgi:tetratricopeptide (TPR) repeat protein